MSENSENFENREREELIERIINEKGPDAFDDMLKLLDDEDENVKEIATEVLYRLGDSVRPKIEEYVKKEVLRGEKNNMKLLYLIDLLGDMGAKNSVKDILKALELYDFEEAQIVIYEALAKLGAGEQFYPLLRYMLLEGEERFTLGPQVAIAMSYLDIPEIIHDLVQAIDSSDFSGEDLETIKQALSNVINTRPSYKEILITLVGEENFEKYVL
ncbi:HEAT repeat domain-containing protein [Fervidobacterium nodosum]|uniref:HEAT repeat domain-containing protein n=1 Tax=Fervidobacterium nodosum (strain ATCC 35602 / DSM 5306 / Rt17-B1) TaxID=381764 RepID=A7HLJ0_FERNB|nr:hypothetical protein [Fervidobacterium nodosum]ABS60773.1 conserved hypothetical protein [Fervidobacterium nodosum Rt17-B1]